MFLGLLSSPNSVRGKRNFQNRVPHHRPNYIIISRGREGICIVKNRLQNQVQEIPVGFRVPSKALRLHSKDLRSLSISHQLKLITSNFPYLESEDSNTSSCARELVPAKPSLLAQA